MRLIDADALTSKIQKQYCEDCNRRKGENNGKRYMVYEIGDAPCRACSIDDMYAELDDAPTITPEPHWIPVTEPPKGDFMPYYATCRSKVDDRENWVIEGMYTKYSGWEYPPMVRDDRAEIIAWMPKELPEPFKGVADGRD